MPEIEAASTALRQGTEPTKLVKQLGGDLDWIILRALEKDRNRRYENTFDFAQDIQRHLEDRTVVARPPNQIYRFSKLVRRNRLAFAAAGGFAVALAIGLGVAAWQYHEKSIAYRRALEAERGERLLREAAQRAQAAEAGLRRQAQVQEARARRKSYAADMNLAQQALDLNNLGRAARLLEAQIPRTGDESYGHGPTDDLRDWEWRCLWGESRSQALYTVCQGLGAIDSLAVSPDDSCLAIAQKSNLSIWDLSTKRESARLPPIAGDAGVVFSPIAPLLAFGTLEQNAFLPGQGLVLVWDTVNRRSVAELRLSGVCRGLAFSADGLTLASASANGELALWSIARAERLSGCSLPGTWRLALPIQFSPDLGFAACGTEGGQLRVIDTHSGKELWKAQNLEENLHCLAFSPDGRLLASAGGFLESAIRLRDARTGREVGRLAGHRSWVNALVFWPDGRTLASSSADQTICLWDLRSLTLIQTLRGHRTEVRSLALSPHVQQLFSGSKDGWVCAWDVRIPRGRGQAHRSTFPDRIRAWRFTADSQNVLAVDRDGHVSRYRGADFREKQDLLDLDGPPHWADFSADGQFLVAGRQGDSLEVWSATELRLLRSIELPPRGAIPVAVLPRSNYLLTSSYDGTFHEWDLATGDEVRTWHSEAIATMPQYFALSLNEQWLVGVESGGKGFIRQLTAEREWRMDFALDPLTGIVISRDGGLVVALGWRGDGHLWDTQKLRLTAVFHGSASGLASAAFSPDGRRLALASSGDEGLRLWDVEGRLDLLTLSGDGPPFLSVAFSPDGNSLAAVDARGTLYIWSPPSAVEIEELRAGEYPPEAFHSVFPE